MVFYHIKWLSYLREVLEATNVHRLPWVCLLYISAEVILHIPYFPFVEPADKSVMHFQNPFFNQDCGSKLVALLLNIAFDGDTLGVHLVVLQQLQLLVC